MMNNDIVVIGAGQCRTGTLSLKMALEQLLHGKCYHMKDIMSRPEDISKWIKAAEVGLSDAEWRTFFTGYSATVDYPGVAFYREILRVYPKAKVILSIRRAESWVKSMQVTVLSHDSYTFPLSFVNWFTPMRQFIKLRTLMLRSCLGGEFDVHDEAASIVAFNAWNESVKSTVPSDRLLIFEAKEGWKPLCNFLGLPVPDEPYPNVNSINEFQQMVRKAHRISWLIILGVSVTIGGIVLGAYHIVH